MKEKVIANWFAIVLLLIVVQYFFSAYFLYEVDSLYKEIHTSRTDFFVCAEKPSKNYKENACFLQEKADNKCEENSYLKDYDFGLLCRVITAEGGSDENICRGVAQCLYNACENDGWQKTPIEMLEEQKYTQPVDWISDAARNACIDIFIFGKRYDPVKNATVFYATKYCTSIWHEQQIFVCEINGVRFFEQNN